MKLAIVIVSIGNRPWLELTFPTVLAYAASVGAIPFLFDTLPTKSEFPIPDLPERPGRRNKLAYAMKLYLPAKLLGEFDRVICMDDSCLITKETPDLFKILKKGHVAGVPEPGGYGREHCIKATLNTVDRHAGRLISGNAPYFNGGLMIYDKSYLDLCSPERIIANRELLLCGFLDQAMNHFFFCSGGARTQTLPQEFNSINIFEGERSSVCLLSDPLESAYIYHVTGWWDAYRDGRHNTIKMISERLCGEGRI